MSQYSIATTACDFFRPHWHIPFHFSPLVLSDQGGQGYKKNRTAGYHFVLYFVLSLASLRVGTQGWDFLSPKFHSFFPLLQFSQDPHPTPAEGKWCSVLYCLSAYEMGISKDTENAESVCERHGRSESQRQAKACSAALQKNPQGHPCPSPFCLIFF